MVLSGAKNILQKPFQFFLKMEKKLLAKTSFSRTEYGGQIDSDHNHEESKIYDKYGIFSYI
jgi:tRNA U54 and U55 pseudouridine synthase Pus10